MRIIFLNTWEGKVGEAFESFVFSKCQKTDIFCFMEVSGQMFKKLSNSLPGFNGFHTLNFGENGQAVFVSKNIETVSSERIELYKQEEHDNGCLQRLELNYNGKKFFVGSVHGKTNPGDKLDTDIRIQQSKKIIESFTKENGPTIIGGDFNLDFNTKSINMFEEDGYKNLIKDFDIKSTRNRHAWGRFQDEPGFAKQYFADYCFVSPDIKVMSFEVPNVEVSDHEPLVLDLEL